MAIGRSLGLDRTVTGAAGPSSLSMAFGDCFFYRPIHFRGKADWIGSDWIGSDRKVAIGMAGAAQIVVVIEVEVDAYASTYLGR